jgi:hypothetical protein
MTLKRLLAAALTLTAAAPSVRAAEPKYGDIRTVVVI